MFEITYAKNGESIVEVEITGTLAEIRELEKTVIDLSQNMDQSFTLTARTNFIPKFGDGWIKELILMSSGDDVKVLANPPDSLSIKGSPEKLEVFSGYCHFEDDDKYPTHHHCEWRDEHPCLAPGSVPLIISIADEKE
jgi:hypothetical protein